MILKGYTNKINKRLFCLFMILVLTVFLAACSSKKGGEPFQVKEGSGQHVARVYVEGYGSFDLRLFEEEAKETVESFMGLAETGFYDGKPVYSVIEDYCLLMGDVAGIKGSGADEGKAFKNASRELYPFTGALCVINDGSGAGAEHFMIVTADSEFLVELKELLAYKMITPQEYFKTAYGKDVSDEDMELFYKYGGAPWLMGDCIVFGQIYEGIDVLKKICNVEVSDDASYSPVEEILIDHIEVK